jgi:CubicO group peptidase (beta-lactamase class C family)
MSASQDNTLLGAGLVGDLERQVRAAQSQWHSPAVSAGIVRDGSLVWSTHVGAARLDPMQAPTDHTQYMIGSITKTFTAVLVMALRDAGRMSLDDRLERYLPQTRHGAVTIRSLLAHASGLQREPVGRIWENIEPPDSQRLLSELEDAEQVLPSHLAFHYSNLAFALLGQIVERLERRPWGEVVTERILAPLEMKDTGLTPDHATRALGLPGSSAHLGRDPRTGFRAEGGSAIWRTLEHDRRPWPLRLFRRGPDRGDSLARHHGRDVPAGDHDRCRGLEPSVRAGI